MTEQVLHSSLGAGAGEGGGGGRGVGDPQEEPWRGRGNGGGEERENGSRYKKGMFPKAAFSRQIKKANV